MSRGRRCRLAVVAGALVAVALAAPRTSGPQTPSPQAQPPTFRSGVELVAIEAAVISRNGDPIVTLGSDDFTIKVDGRARRVVWGRMVRADGPAPGDAPEPTLPPGFAAGTARLVAVVIDRDTIPVGEGQATLKAAADFVSRLRPVDRVAVCALPLVAGRLDFSADREGAMRSIRMAVGTYRPPQPPTAERIEEDWHDRAIIALRSLEALVESLSAIDHPKHMVFITGGPVATADDRSLIAGIGVRASAARVTIHAVQVYRASHRARTDAMNAPADADPGRPTQKGVEIPDLLDQTASAAYFLAGATGGLATTPVAPEIGFRQLDRELSASYILAIEVEPGDRDGKDHRIDVDAANQPLGTRVRARTSFRIEPARTEIR